MSISTLFVCHEGQRTGAPLVLLWLIRWLLANSDIRPQVALMRDGPLREEFEAICPTYTFIQPIAEPWTRRLRRRFDPSLSPDRGLWLANLIERIRPDCLYLNTLVLGSNLAKLRFQEPRPVVISHAHELEISLQISSTPEHVRRQLALSDIVLCCAESVEQQLVKDHGVDPGRCLVVPEYLGPAEKPPPVAAQLIPAEIS
jgi:hypothetical protein